LYLVEDAALACTRHYGLVGVGQHKLIICVEAILLILAQVEVRHEAGLPLYVVHDWIGDLLHHGLIPVVLVGRAVYVVVAEGDELALHPIDGFEWEYLTVLLKVHIVPDDVFPELGGKQYGCEHERPPIEIANLYIARDHDLLQIDETDYDTLGGQLHLVHDESHELGHILILRLVLFIIELLQMVRKEGHGTGISIGSVDRPPMSNEVVLVKKLGALGWLWYQSLGLLDVHNYNLTHIIAQLLTSQH
jgi:hypothetical protein